MATRKIRKRKLVKFPVGDMRDRITVHVRQVTEPPFDDVDYTETYDDGVECWASIETPTRSSLTGQNMFNGVNINDKATHVFIVRFDSAITAQNMIRFEGETYKILPTTNPERRDGYLLLPARLLGDSDLKANE